MTQAALALMYATKNLVIGVLVYGGLVSLSHGIEYYRRYKERELRATQLTAQLSKAELEVLKMQLQPHFLFNTLHAISALVRARPRRGGPDHHPAGRSAPDEPRSPTATQEVPLRHELEFVEKYADIQRTRFRDRLSIAVDADPDALDAHGAEPDPPAAGGELDPPRRRARGSRRPAIRSAPTRRGDRLLLSVTDNGPGFPDDVLTPVPGRGLGLANTRARLAALYGDDGRLGSSRLRPGAARWSPSTCPSGPRAMPPLSVLVVDDEPLARERIRALLDDEPDVKIVGECASGRSRGQGDPGQAARPGVSRRADAGGGRVRRGGADRRRADAGDRVRDRVRPVRRSRRSRSTRSTTCSSRSTGSGSRRRWRGRARRSGCAPRARPIRGWRRCSSRSRPGGNSPSGCWSSAPEGTAAGGRGGGLVRGRGELREDPHRRRAAAAAGDDGQSRGAARPRAVRPDPSLDHRESQAGSRSWSRGSTETTWCGCMTGRS